MEIIPPKHMLASSIVLMAGTTSDSISDIQAINDGNTYTVVETGGTPGFDIHIVFKNILRFSGITHKAYYDPGSHYIEEHLWNYDTGQFDVFTTIENTQGFNTRFIEIEECPCFIRNGEVIFAFDHIPGGNGAHRFHIDYVALVR